MKLVIGGFAQGKLQYVLRTYRVDENRIFDGELPEGEEEAESARETGAVVVSHFHRWVRKRILEGGCPEKEAKELLRRYPGCIVISDEVGCGIVPLEASEREYRERVGRILTELAGQAEEVERVICGIGQRIK